MIDEMDDELVDELVALVDADGVVTGAERRSVVRRDNLRHAATAVLVRSPEGEVFVHRRAPTKDWAPSHWDAAAGGILSHGEEPDGSARRELAEELGLAVETLVPRGLSRYEDETTRVVEHVFETTVPREVHFDFADGEVTEGRWMSLPDLARHLADPAWPFVPDTRALLADLAARGEGDWAALGPITGRDRR